jgi:hypothetical protein
MTLGQAFYLILSLVAFSAFALTLAYQSHADGKRTPKE